LGVLGKLRLNFGEVFRRFLISHFIDTDHTGAFWLFSAPAECFSKSALTIDGVEKQLRKPKTKKDRKKSRTYVAIYFEGFIAKWVESLLSNPVGVGVLLAKCTGRDFRLPLCYW
jgi:hypothetical protein